MTTIETEQSLIQLFKQADQIGKKRYHKLTPQDFDDYRKFDFWRYVGGDGECGTTAESKEWVRENSEYHCPVCNERYTQYNGRSIDHKLPRSQFPWFSLNFQNLWVICLSCNKEKGERHWYEYEHYIFTTYPDRYLNVNFARPNALLHGS